MNKQKKCKACGDNRKLVKHHVKYSTKDDPSGELVTLCENCHNMLHRFIKGRDPDIKKFTTIFIKAGKFWK